MLVMPTLFCLLMAQPEVGIACLHSVTRLAMSAAVTLMNNSDNSELVQALQMHAAREPVRLLQEAL